MRKILIVCAVFCPFWLFSETGVQVFKPAPSLKISSGQFFFLYRDLNSALIGSGYYPVDRNDLSFLSYGIEISSPKQPFYLSMTVQTEINTAMKGQSDINYAGLNLDVFYDFCKNDKWVLAPMFGAGLSNVNLSAVSQDKISELTGMNLQETVSKTDLFCIRPGIAAKRYFSLKKFFPSKDFFGSIGIECYYQIETGSGKWRNVLNQKADNFAVSKMTGFVFGITGSLYVL